MRIVNTYLGKISEDCIQYNFGLGPFLNLDPCWPLVLNQDGLNEVHLQEQTHMVISPLYPFQSLPVLTGIYWLKLTLKTINHTCAFSESKRRAIRRDGMCRWKMTKVGGDPVAVITAGIRRGLGATGSMVGHKLCRKYRPWNLPHCLVSH